MDFSVSLKMRNYDELSARVARGETVSPAEMSASYYPLESAYQAVVDWLSSSGFKITRTDPRHLTVFASGTVNQLQAEMHVSFGEVAADDRSYVSATTAPMVPSSLASIVLGVNGLQPHLHPRKHLSGLVPNVGTNTSFLPPFSPAEILKAYEADSLGATGSGEKIAIVIDTFPTASDLTTFWAINHVSQSLNNIEEVHLMSGTYPAPTGEETLDVEWSSSIAPGATVRIYGTQELSFVSLDQAFQAILDDIPGQPRMHQVSISLGVGESDISPSQIQTDAQYFASMAAHGLTVLVSSGDEGSYVSGILQVSYFASDPNVTAVGGTSLSLSNCSGATAGETAWNGSGGGISGVFQRPSWQFGATVPPGSMRLVPDVSTAADPFTGGLIVLHGVQDQIGGTSWSAPVWAGFCALLNQKRANAGLSPLGLLGPKIYPLAGTTAFRDITTGTNGAYNAAAGYDLVTGLGAPRLSTLAIPLTNGPTPPASTAATDQLIGHIQLPDPTCPLPGDSATFHWSRSTVNGAFYWLLVGTTPLGSDIFSSSQTGGVTALVTNLPTDGREVYVTLFSNVGGTWVNPPDSFTYTAFAGIVMTPVITPNSGTYKKNVTVSMATATPDATIYFTTDGSLPTEDSQVYTGPVVLKPAAKAKQKKTMYVVQARAFKNGVPASPPVQATYTITKK
jgi:kumamolisin